MNKLFAIGLLVLVIIFALSFLGITPDPTNPVEIAYEIATAISK